MSGEPAAYISAISSLLNDLLACAYMLTWLLALLFTCLLTHLLTYLVASAERLQVDSQKPAASVHTSGSEPQKAARPERHEEPHPAAEH